MEPISGSAQVHVHPLSKVRNGFAQGRKPDTRTLQLCRKGVSPHLHPTPSWTWGVRPTPTCPFSEFCPALASVDRDDGDIAYHWGWHRPDTVLPLPLSLAPPPHNPHNCLPPICGSCTCGSDSQWKISHNFFHKVFCAFLFFSLTFFSKKKLALRTKQKKFQLLSAAVSGDISGAMVVLQGTQNICFTRDQKPKKSLFWTEQILCLTNVQTFLRSTVDSCRLEKGASRKGPPSLQFGFNGDFDFLFENSMSKECIPYPWIRFTRKIDCMSYQTTKMLRQPLFGVIPRYLHTYSAVREADPSQVHRAGPSSRAANYEAAYNALVEGQTGGAAGKFVWGPHRQIGTPNQ